MEEAIKLLRIISKDLFYISNNLSTIGEAFLIIGNDDLGSQLRIFSKTAEECRERISKVERLVVSEATAIAQRHSAQVLEAVLAGTTLGQQDKGNE